MVTTKEELEQRYENGEIDLDDYQEGLAKLNAAEPPPLSTEPPPLPFEPPPLPTEPPPIPITVAPVSEIPPVLTTAPISADERYKDAKALYDEKQYNKAVPFLETLACEGHAEAQYYLGTCYYYGEGVSVYYDKATEWFCKAAEQGLANAQHLLGCCYKNGLGVPQNYGKAAELFHKAAEQGHALAQKVLDMLKLQGKI
jgi:hypothetical protein